VAANIAGALVYQLPAHTLTLEGDKAKVLKKKRLHKFELHSPNNITSAGVK
jgi:hypothetical protein